MINLATATLLTHYNRWANQLLFASLEQLPPAELDKPRQTAMKTMIATLNHMYVVGCIWQGHLLRRDHGFTSKQAIPFPALADLREAQQRLDDWYAHWCAEQSETSLGEPLDFTFVCGDPGTLSAGSMLLHAVNHSTYHRGWLVQMYFEIPAMPPMTDLSIYLTDAQREPRATC